MFFIEKKWVFTGLVVGVVVFITWHVIPVSELQPFFATLFAFVATLVGIKIGERLFPD